MGKKKYITIIVIACMIFSISIVANAKSLENYNVISENEKIRFNSLNTKPVDRLIIILDELVKEGKIKESKVSLIKDYLNEREEIKRKNILNELKKEGLITEEEIYIIRERIIEMKNLKLDETLNNLINKGVLTEIKAKEVKNYLKKARENKVKKHCGLKNMTKEERKKYFKDKKMKKDIFKEMVKDGVITEKQSKLIRNEFKANRKKLKTK
ncbi:MAG: hypothetical protein FH751_00545 [Firmicutes bacterium]|nr:hypothetical protein [Bacillota bacterium]